ncbi:P-loop NTPase family protein [Spirosoma sordidisoli]|uniref:ATPase n=1 Tax=Spirosoma sordidisoli TaxID=2502893 RepID=A0A4Q2UPK9_9BACT|nr:hypothetical protein [Spirosoma sordidisoli]RYC70832.1 hypothetical protein EQG79_01390 [Spirosoma sordidisoli]
MTEEEEQDWLAQNLPSLLVAGQKAKHHILEGQKLAQKIAAASFIPDTPELLMAEVVKRGEAMAKQKFWRKPFSLTKWNEHIYQTLAYYFTGDARFETEGCELMGVEPGVFDLRKGILLSGPKGCGKTDMLELFSRNPYAPYIVISCLELEMAYSKKEVGSNIIDQYAGLIPTQNVHHYYGKTHLGVQFDDFGAEGEAVHMGKRVNLMDVLLQTRYRIVRGPYTHLTTNASEQGIQEAYDGRVYDRMIQMFNFIEFSPNAPSLRV